jgi:GDPmannose 4,6-dehydratase
LQQRQPEDFVIASGRQYSVRDFIDAAAGELGIKMEWRGKGVKETGVIAVVPKRRGESRLPFKKGQVIVRVDPGYFRPTEVETLLGDPTKARRKLKWKPRVTFAELVTEMMREDMKSAERDALVKRHGFPAYDHFE